VLNFTSYNEEYPRLNLYPPEEFGYNYDLIFDIKYASYILTNDIIFMDFMKIMYNLYLGLDVFILVEDSLEQLNESLFKLIQQRYGYNANRINCYEDFLEAQESSFAEFGLLNIDNDKERLAYLVEIQNLEQAGR
jgi:hypothetical protein